MKRFLLAFLFLPTYTLAQDCDSIAGEPVRYDVDFETEVQPYFSGSPSTTAFCASCHTTLTRGSLNLLPENARANLLGADESGAPSANFPGWKRVVPGDPASSLVFQRVHCNTSPPGRMPPGFSNGNAEFILFQARLHDWIATGAIMDSTDRRSMDSFESVR